MLIFPVSVFKTLIIKASLTPSWQPHSYYSDSFSFIVALCAVCVVSESAKLFLKSCRIQLWKKGLYQNLAKRNGGC